MIQLSLYISVDKEAFDIKYYVQMTANKYLLNGTYQELPKDWVHVKVEGIEEEVNAFANSILNGAMKRYIYESHREYKDAENFRDFATIGRSMELPDFLQEDSNWFSRFTNLFYRPKNTNPGSV